MRTLLTKYRKTLIFYVTLWIAIAPAVTLIAVMAYLVTEWYPQPLWASILAMIVTVHVVMGWVWFIANKGVDIADGKEDETN